MKTFKQFIDEMQNAGPSTPVKVYTGTSIETGKKYKRVLPYFGAGRVNSDTIRLKGV